MESEKLQWWEKDVSVKFESIVTLFKTICLFLIPIKILHLLWYPCWEFFHYEFIPVALILLVSLLGFYVKKRSPYIKIAYSFFLSEFINCLSLYVSENLYNEKIIICITSVFILVFFQLEFVQSRVISGFFILKFCYQWYFSKAWSGIIPVPPTTSSYTALVVIVGLYCIASQNEKKNSFNTFKSEKLLRKANDKHEVLLGLISDGFCIISKNLEVLECNQNLIRLLNCEEENIFTVLMEEIYLENRKTNCLNEGNSLGIDVISTFKSEILEEIDLGVTEVEESKYSWKAKVVEWEGEKCVLVTSRNIDEMVRLEQSLTEISVKNSLLRQVSHELKTPTYAIQHYSEYLKNDLSSSLSEEQVKSLSIIETSSQMLLFLINDLLDYSKLVSGVFVIKKGYFDLIKLIEECFNLVIVLINNKNIVLKKRIDPDLSSLIYSDEARLKQILLNLLSNALKFTNKGFIEVCITVIIPGVVKVEVRDTGIGIEESKLDEIFKEFNTDQSIFTNPTGTGLGLYISNILAQELGKEPIEVSSTLGKGSEFSFLIQTEIVLNWLLQVPNSTCSFEADAEFNEIEIDPIVEPYKFEMNKDIETNVLIVDDNDFNREILARILEYNEISFSESWNGEETVKAVKRQDEKGLAFKLIVLDLNLPDMSGLEVIQKLKKLLEKEEIKKIPSIIGYTAGVSEEVKKKCFENGMLSIMPKPSPANEIVSNIMKNIHF